VPVASLFIKDHDTADIVRRLARRTGMTQTTLVRELASAREVESDRDPAVADFDAKLADLYRRFPPTSPAVTPDHKPLFDALWGDPD
jgi:antitoxin VapB